ncbi:MAG: GNAT family N-acetyltransferase [Clostridia bacterium]|nr:GNAT family N-acetyltransferase [Clostridia bacterium]
MPEYQNQGIGFAAISQIIEMLRQRSYQKLALYTDLENHKARACYQKCGFEVVETFTEEMANGKTVARCMMEMVL